MNGTNARAGKHREDGFGHHGHIDDDSIAGVDAEVNEHAGRPLDLVLEIGIGVCLLFTRCRTVVDQRVLVGAPALDVTVDSVVAGVEAPALVPAIERRIARIEHLFCGLIPVDPRSSFAPEFLRVFEGRSAPVGQRPGHRILISGAEGVFDPKFNTFSESLSGLEALKRA